MDRCDETTFNILTRTGCMSGNWLYNTWQEQEGYCYLQHSIGLDATCRDRVLPLGCGMWTRKISRTRVFFLPMSVSPFRSSISEFLSFNIPAQSMLSKRQHRTFQLTLCRFQKVTNKIFIPSLPCFYLFTTAETLRFWTLLRCMHDNSF